MAKPGLGLGMAGGGGSGASTALSNLASVAINTSLISDTANTDDLGSATKEWKDLYLAGNLYFGTDQGSKLAQESTASAGVGVYAGSTLIAKFAQDTVVGLRLRSTDSLQWTAGAASAAPDLDVYRVAAGIAGVSGALASHGGVGGFQPAQSANGFTVQELTLSELVTIAAAATTDTTIEIPADAQVLAVSGRVTTLIPTAANFDIGIAGATTRYGTGVLVAAGTTFKGSLDGLRGYAAATKIRITPNLTPGDTTGRVRVTIQYRAYVAPTS